MPAHCPLSRCHTDPGYCASKVSDDEMTMLVVIVSIPILMAFLAPIVASRFSNCKSAMHGCCHCDDDRPARAATHRSAIDPPMFLCGVGLIPLECGLSGLLTIIWVMGSAFVVLFFSLLTSEHPCATGLGECRTISCICGNVLSQGYVFMFCSLVLTSAILVQRISRMFHHMRAHHKVIKALLVLGALLLALTGIFPEQYDVNERLNDTMYSLHLCGVYGAAILLLGVPYSWFFEHFATHRSGPDRVPVSSLVVRTLYVACVAGYVGALEQYGSLVEDQTADYCKAMKNETECESWPSMPPQACADALKCAADADKGVSNAACDFFVQPNFLCQWTPNELSTWTRAIAPASYINLRTCVRTSCPIFSYARGVALEFAVLFLTLSYVSTFSLHDTRRLLDRPRSPHAGNAAPVAVAQDASALLASTQAATAAGNKRLAEDLRAAGGDEPGRSSPPAAAAGSSLPGSSDAAQLAPPQRRSI